MLTLDGPSDHHRCRNIVVLLTCLVTLVNSAHQWKLTPDQLVVQEQLDEQSGILDHLLKDYDKRLIPALNGKPVKVDLQVKVSDVFSMDDSKMESEMILFIRQTWYDYRLSHNFSQKIKVREHLLDKIWLPDIRMSNLKDVKRFDGLGGINMNIHPSGRIYFSQLVLVTISCPMDLRSFPMDKQTCFLNFSSYAYARTLMFFSLSKKKVIVNPVNLPQFDFVEAEKIDDTEKSISVLSITNKVSRVSIAITFKRRWGYYFLQIYLPCIFLVLLSWLAFLMESSDIADRLALEVTMILSIVFLLGGINTSLPHVSYAKASDWFIIVSFTFVFTALVETMLVYRLTSLGTSSQRQRNCLRGFQKCWANVSDAHKMEKIAKDCQVQNGGDSSEDEMMECSTFGSKNHRPTSPVQAAESKPRNLTFWVDTICLIAFPVSYTVFNICYWAGYFM